MKTQFLRKYPISYYLIVAIFIILMVAAAGLIGISYLVTDYTLHQNAHTIELQTENNLAAVFESKEEAIRIYEESLNDKMASGFPPFLAGYQAAGRDPSRMDLEAIQQEIRKRTGEEMELYIIDANATIVATTYPPELGLRFREFAPYFADYLDRIRNSEGFYPDRIVSEKSTGAMKKFAYMPTPDHQYILELGLPLSAQDIAAFRFLDEELIKQIESSNPYLAGVRIFDTTLRERINTTSVEIKDPALKGLLAGVLANRTTLEVPRPGDGITTRYVFVDLGNDAYGSDVSRIIALQYTHTPIDTALSSAIAFYLALGVIAFVCCALLTFFAIRNITLPIGRMADDVDRIAGGDLDRPLTPPIGSELLRLEESISTMVTQLKNTIAELSASEATYRTLVQSANSIILRFDTMGTVTFINDYALKFFGFSRDEIFGKNLVGTIVPEFSSTGENLAAKILDLSIHPELYETSENENTRKDGSKRWIAWTNRPLYDNTGKISEILSIGNDITRLKEVEREIQRLNNELELRVAERTRQLTEVNKNLESFTYTVSHDLRAPLRAISGYSSILLQDLKDIPDKDRKYLESLRQSSHEMGRLIDDLLDLSRLKMRPVEKETVQPALIVKEILKEIRADPDASRVEFRVGELPACLADPMLMKQVYANLISNALKFSRKREHPLIKIGSLAKDGILTYYVRDNGVGFDMRYADKVFGVFERLHNVDEYEGTGVGLAIVQRIVDLHGGRIWVESEIEKGTTFYFTCW